MTNSTNRNAQIATSFDLPEVRLALLEKRAVVVDGSVVNKNTGEIIGEYVQSLYEPGPVDYSIGVAAKINSLATDDSWEVAEIVIGTPTITTKFGISRDAATANSIRSSADPKKNPKGAGRKPKSTVNPIAHIVVELVSKPRGQETLSGRPTWLDDILFGSCLTAADQSRNVCNVEMTAVLAALHMKKFEVQAVMANGVAKRKAQLIIKAARHAANGIHNYLLRHPELLKEYEEAARIELRYAYSHVVLVPFTPPVVVPQHITDLYLNGDYIAYGESLRAFRLKSAYTQSKVA